MLKEMPSPNGTNIERLYILRGRGAPSNPTAAYDSAPHAMTTTQAARYGAALAKRLVGGPRLAYDAAPVDPMEGAGGGEGGSNAVAQIVTWALGNLTPADLDELVASLTRERTMSLDHHRRHAMDTRRPSRSMSSAASKSFNEMFPDAARIKY